MDSGARRECFGLPYGNLIGPLIVGMFLILMGLSFYFGWDFWSYIWPVLIIIIGVLIIAGAIFGYKNRR
jgi:hypothetical protein